MLLSVPSFGQTDTTVAVKADTVRLLRNPMTGWVIYAGLGDGLDDNFWQKYDQFTSSAGTVKVSDYATTLFIRAAWSLFNPEEGVYVWQDSCTTKAAQRFRMLVNGAKERGLKLAFSFITDSRDKHFNFTPDYVKAAGCKGFESTTGSVTVWSPYPDDPVFQTKFKQFLTDFAARYDDPATVQFISGTGIGKWGESHSVKYSTGDETPRAQVFGWITDVMSSLFKRVPILVNYHRWIFTGKEWDGTKYDAQSEALLDSAVAKGFSLRHDAFGMKTYYSTWEKNYAAKWRYQRPIVAEGGWVKSSHGNSIKNDGYADYAEVRQGEFADAKEAHANMMDLRYNSDVTVSETSSWFNDAYDLVNAFIRHGAYRLYPSTVTVPRQLKSETTATIASTWQNLGWGYCPTNIPQWNQKYKVAYALLDASGHVEKTFVDLSSDLSQCLNGSPLSLKATFDLKGVKAGTYRWATALVDTTRQDSVGLELSVDQSQLVNGWLVLDSVKVSAPDRVIKVLAIGNSFSQDAVESHLHQLAEALGYKTIIANMYIGGCSLETHYNNMVNNSAAYSYRKIGTDGVKVTTANVSLETALKDEQWDYVSLQQNSGQSGLYDTYEPYLSQLVSYIRKTVGDSVKLVWHQTWAYAKNSTHSDFPKYNKDQMKMYRAIVDASRKAFNANGFDILVPSGTAVQNARTTFIGDHMNRDGYHLNILYGRYTAACTGCEALFGCVLNNSYAPDGLSRSLITATHQSAHSAWLQADSVTDLSYIDADEQGNVVFVRPDNDSHLTDTRDGNSWSTALSWTDFLNEKDNLYDGDVVCLAGGTYQVPTTLKFTKGLTFIGGFDPALTDTTTAAVYPTVTPTVLSGDVNGDGSANAGDLCAIMAFDFSQGGLESLPIRLRGINFTGAYVPKDSANTVMGALYLKNCQDVAVERCNFTGNVAAGYGGSAVRAEYSTVHFTDCQFTGNQADSRGGAIRLSSNSASKGYTTLERCLLANNEVKQNVGSAICVQHGQGLYLVNTIVTGNKAASGGAIYNNGKDNTYQRKLCLVNSTVAGNSGSYEIEFPKAANLNMVNSIVAGGHTTDLYTRTVSQFTDGGHNIVGTVSSVFTLEESTTSGKTVNDIFGSDNVYVSPVLATSGVAVETVGDLANSWGIEADTSVDYYGNPREATTCPGAVSSVTTGIRVVPSQRGVASDRVYNLNGMLMKGTLHRGIYIRGGKKVVVR